MIARLPCLASTAAIVRMVTGVRNVPTGIVTGLYIHVEGG